MKRMTSCSSGERTTTLSLRNSWNGGSPGSMRYDDCEHTIIHPGAVGAMLKLIPSLDNSQHPPVRLPFLSLRG